MTEQITRPATVEALAALSYEEILDRLTDLRRSLEQTTNALSRLANRRAGLLERAGIAEFPKLTRKVCDHVKLRHPGFFTPERNALAQLHGKLWGIFNRRGTLAALELLRVDYRAYLEEAGYVAAEDRDMWNLHDQQAGFRDEIFRLEELEVLHPVHRVGVTKEAVEKAPPEGSAEGWCATLTPDAVALI